MCSINCVFLCVKNLSKKDIIGKRVIEVGSRDVNGTIRPFIELYKPSEYVGVDMIEGQSVDVICKAEDLIKKFGKNSFDVVISTEALEHASDWKKFISNIKNICKPKGIILVTTRSRGFGYHGYPYDFWRYELDDMRHIFSDFEILSLEKDIIGPGVLIKVRKPNKFMENDLSDYKLYSIISNKKKTEIIDSDLKSFRFKRITIIEKIKNFSKSTYHKAISGLYNPKRIMK